MGPMKTGQNLDLRTAQGLTASFGKSMGFFIFYFTQVQIVYHLIINLLTYLLTG